MPASNLTWEIKIHAYRTGWKWSSEQEEQQAAQHCLEWSSPSSHHLWWSWQSWVAKAMSYHPNSYRASESVHWRQYHEVGLSSQALDCRSGCMCSVSATYNSVPHVPWDFSAPCIFCNNVFIISIIIS